MLFIGRVISWINGLTVVACGGVVLLLVAHVTVDVTMRYLFNAPLNSTILYVSLFYMTAIAFVPLGAVEEQNAQISVEVITEMLPNAVVTVLIALGLLATLTVAGAVSLRGWEEAMAQFRRGSFAMESGVRVSTWQTYFTLPLGFGLLFVVALYKLICMLTGTRSGLNSFMALNDPGAPILKEVDRD